MAHALLARGLRALLRAHQTATPWAATAGAAGRGSVPCAGCRAETLLPQGVAASGRQLPAPQGACQLHTAAAAVQAVSAAAACRPATVTDASQQQLQNGQQRRSFRTTSGEQAIHPGCQAALRGCCRGCWQGRRERAFDLACSSAASSQGICYPWQTSKRRRCMKYSYNMRLPRLHAAAAWDV